MSLLVETIACIDGKLQNLPWHNARLNTSRSDLFKSKDKWMLEDIRLPEFVKAGNWKCRVIYDTKFSGISYEPYVPTAVKSLQVIEGSFNYCYKYYDRTELDELYKQKGEADDIIIIKNGLVTDTSIANILLYDGDGWVTPDTPLLAGTMRSQLINKKLVRPKTIKATDLTNYKKLMLVNALNPFADTRAIDISKNLINY